jgi:phage shock protein A
MNETIEGLQDELRGIRAQAHIYERLSEQLQGKIARLTTENETLSRRLPPEEVAAALRELLAECEPDPIAEDCPPALKSFKQGANHDRRLQAKLIKSAAARLGLTL